MKKSYLLFVLLGLGHLSFSQNQFPTTKGSNVVIDGGAINMIKNPSTEGWARGLNYFMGEVSGTTRFGAFGIFGVGETPQRMYMAHGESPWNNGNGIYVLSNGNVGIGSINPDVKLMVEGSVRLNPGRNNNNYLQVQSNSDSQINLLFHVQNETKWNMYTQGDGKLVFRKTDNNADGGVKMVIDGDNVGIGTGSPGNWRLAVNGNIRAKEVKVDTGWSDFVFEDGYRLPSLDEVEQHIKEKGHLKDIPSAREVEENGVFLGAMDAKLLQKIEELTLYVIELKKENKEQQKLIEHLIGQVK